MPPNERLCFENKWRQDFQSFSRFLNFMFLRSNTFPLLLRKCFLQTVYILPLQDDKLWGFVFFHLRNERPWEPLKNSFPSSVNCSSIEQAWNQLHVQLLSVSHCQIPFQQQVSDHQPCKWEGRKKQWVSKTAWLHYDFHRITESEVGKDLKKVPLSVLHYWGTHLIQQCTHIFPSLPFLLTYLK